MCQQTTLKKEPSCSQCLTSSTTYKGPLLDNNFKQNPLDTFIFCKSRIGICMNQGPRLDIIAKKSILNGSA